MTQTARKAVAIGGGTGLPKVLWCLLEEGYDTTAVVTVADDGGSSGALRAELGMLPPGDARNCLVAMSADPDSTIARVFSYRFPHGAGLAGHSLGNLVIAALADMETSFPAALEAAGRLLGSRGRVLPSTLDDVILAADDVAGERVVGQRNVAASRSPIACVHYAGEDRARAYPPALEAIETADVVVIGPGSLFTSILPNFLVDGMIDALRHTRARVVYVCNVANQRGETTGMDAADHVDALLRHGLTDCIDVVLVHDETGSPLPREADAVRTGPAAMERLTSSGVRVHVSDLADPADWRHHDRDALLDALKQVTA
jgi:uncharacterized cofD-like protein